MKTKSDGVKMQSWLLAGSESVSLQPVRDMSVPLVQHEARDWQLLGERGASALSAVCFDPCRPSR